MLLEDRRLPMWLAGAACNGAEAALTDCPGVAFGINIRACAVSDVLAVLCFNNVDSDGMTELQGMVCCNMSS